MSTAKQKPASDLEREVFSIQCTSGSATSMSVGVCDIFFIFFESLVLSSVSLLLFLVFITLLRNMLVTTVKIV